MPIEEVTSNRAYPLPHATNELDEDIVRLRAALAAIDADMQQVLAQAAGNIPIYSNVALTGAPTAPTPASVTANDRIATASFVHTVAQQKAEAAVAALLGAAPGALNTLAELAAALNNDPSFATTITNLIAAKAAQVHSHDAGDIVTGQVNMARLAVASKAEAEAGTSSVRVMTPQRTKEAIEALSSVVPIGAMMDWTTETAPPKWIFAHGQAISRTTYAALFARWGTRYGAGDGLTTFGVPDTRGRVTAGWPNGGRLTGAGGHGINADIIGAAGGAEFHTLTENEMAHHTHGINIHDPGHVHGMNLHTAGQLGSSRGLYNGTFDGQPTLHGYGNGLNTLAAGTGIWATANGAGGNWGHNNVQPTIVFPKIIYVGV
jgi:microcystin-dependent protein